MSGRDGVHGALLRLALCITRVFHHYQLEPHEQIKIGEFTWLRKNGETYVDRPAYPG